MQFKRCLLVCLWRRGELVWIGSIKWIAWRRGLPGGTGGRRKLCMVSCHSYTNLRGLEEQIGDEEGGFKVIQREWGLKQLMIVAYLCICKFKKHYNARYIQKYQISEYIFGVRVLLVCFRNRHRDFPGCSITFLRGGWKSN